jgi:hypothetical protein
MCQIIEIKEIIRKKEAEETIQQLKRSAEIQIRMLADNNTASVKELNIMHKRLDSTIAKIFVMKCFENTLEKKKKELTD